MTLEWQKLDQDKAYKALELINPKIEPIAMDAENTSVRILPLSFYPNLKFYEMTDLSAVPAARKYALADQKSKNVYVVNWTNDPIYEANTEEEFILDKKTVKAYVSFFFAYVRGRHGRFIVIENFDEIKWQNEPPQQGRKVIQEMLAPVKVIDQDEDGTFNLEAYMLFKDALFKTTIHVAPDGNVAMSEEELKIEGMPIIQDVMIA